MYSLNSNNLPGTVAGVENVVGLNMVDKTGSVFVIESASNIK